LLYKSLKKANFVPFITADELYTRLLKVAEEEKFILHDAIERQRATIRFHDKLTRQAAGRHSAR
jgi:hypothetical protein